MPDLKNINKTNLVKIISLITIVLIKTWI